MNYKPGTKHPSVLLLNPPVYDFITHDFWLKPYGLLRVGGLLRNSAHLELFDFLSHDPRETPDRWGRGTFYNEKVAKPTALADIPRFYRRYGQPRENFQAYLKHNSFDYVLLQTGMTYWYPGVAETIADLRALQPQAKIVLGGVYASLCSEHARNLGADFVLQGTDLDPLWKFLNLTPDPDELPFWEGYETLSVGVMKLADGCPFKCTYCSVPKVYPPFSSRGLERAFAELDVLLKRGVKNIAFYDDALLYQNDRILKPFLEGVVERGANVNFHCPNALNARFLTRDVAESMVRAGFKTFFMGFESNAYEWQRKTGGKVYSAEFERAVTALTDAGADPREITAYLIASHPDFEAQHVEASMEFAHAQGVRVMLSEFSPIPGTPDGEKCRSYTDLDEPLNHNKSAFPVRFMGFEKIERLKSKARELNRALSSTRTQPV